MKKIFISSFLAILHNIIFSQTELQETRRVITATELPSSFLNTSSYLSDTIIRFVPIAEIWEDETGEPKEIFYATGIKLTSLKLQLDSINNLPSKSQNKKFKILVDSLTKEINTLTNTIQEKNTAINLEITKALLLQITESITKYNEILNRENTNIEKLRISADSFYNPSNYENTYYMDTLSIALLVKTKSTENIKLAMYKTNISNYQATLLKLENLFEVSNDNFKKGNPVSSETKDSINQFQIKLNNQSSNIKENVDFIDSLRIGVIKLLNTRKIVLEDEPTNKDYSSLINIISPVTSARLLPQLTLNGNLYLPKNGNQDRKLDLALFATIPPAFESDSNNVTKIRDESIGNIFIAEQSTFGLKLSYIHKGYISINQINKTQVVELQNKSAIGFKGSIYYLNKKLPVIGDTGVITSSTNVGFLQIKSGIGLTFYNNILQIYLNGNYLHPLDNLSNYEALLNTKSRGYFYSDAGISALLVTDSTNPITSKLNLNFILINGEIAGVLKTPDKVIATIGFGIGIK